MGNFSVKAQILLQSANIDGSVLIIIIIIITNIIIIIIIVNIIIIIILLFFVFQATKLKAVAYPLICAAVGGICGGPVGLAVGLKAGAAVAFGGGIVGFFGGRYFKKKQDEATDIQLENLSSSKEVKKYR